MIIGLGLLMNPSAYSADPNTTPHNIVWQNGIWLNTVKELPLYEIGSRLIPLRDVDLYIQNFVAVAHHIFVERTPSSLTLGARVAW